MFLLFFTFFQEFLKYEHVYLLKIIKKGFIFHCHNFCYTKRKKKHERLMCNFNIAYLLFFIFFRNFSEKYILKIIGITNFFVTFLFLNLIKILLLYFEIYFLRFNNKNKLSLMCYFNYTKQYFIIL